VAAPVGFDVEDYNSLVTTSASVIADQNQVRFTHEDGPTLVYDYVYQQWSTFDASEAYDGIVWKNQFALLYVSGGVYLEDETIWRDDGEPIQISFTTGWMTFAGIAGYQRVYRFQFTGEYLSAHSLKVSVGYDNKEDWVDTYLFDAAAVAEIEDAYSVQGHLSQQKCESIRFKVEDVTPASAPGSGQALSMTAFSLQVGIKKGMSKLPAAQTVGAT
jgi:hypothetical protein